jgi:hypothetical protein
MDYWSFGEFGSGDWFGLHYSNTPLLVHGSNEIWRGVRVTLSRDLAFNPNQRRHLSESYHPRLRRSPPIAFQLQLLARVHRLDLFPQRFQVRDRGGLQQGDVITEAAAVGGLSAVDGSDDHAAGHRAGQS